MSQDDSLQKIKTQMSLKTTTSKGSDNKKKLNLVQQIKNQGNKVLVAMKLNNVSQKQWCDFALFSMTVWVIYEYGGKFS